VCAFISEEKHLSPYNVFICGMKINNESDSVWSFVNHSFLRTGVGSCWGLPFWNRSYKGQDIDPLPSLSLILGSNPVGSMILKYTLNHTGTKLKHRGFNFFKKNQNYILKLYFRNQVVLYSSLPKHNSPFDPNPYFLLLKVLL
jgi:hypothetical protein